MKKRKLSQLIKSAQTEYSRDNVILAVPEIISKKFIGYCSMREDLLLINEYMELLSKEQLPIINSSLTYACIALYGKCFTDASKAKYPKLEENNVFFNEPNHKEVHDFLMDLRHHFIAHRGESDSEVAATFLLFPKAGEERTQVKYKQIKQIHLGKEQIEKVKDLIRFLLEHVENKIQKAGQKVNDDMFKTFTLPELQSLIISNPE